MPISKAKAFSEHLGVVLDVYQSLLWGPFPVAAFVDANSWQEVFLLSFSASVAALLRFSTASFSVCAFCCKCQQKLECVNNFAC